MNDVDIELHDLERAANTMARLRRKGVCFHGWTQTSRVAPHTCTCRDCGIVFASEADCFEAREDLKAEYL